MQEEVLSAIRAVHAEQERLRVEHERLRIEHEQLRAKLERMDLFDETAKNIEAGLLSLALRQSQAQAEFREK